MMKKRKASGSATAWSLGFLKRKKETEAVTATQRGDRFARLLYGGWGIIMRKRQREESSSATPRHSRSSRGDDPRRSTSDTPRNHRREVGSTPTPSPAAARRQTNNVIATPDSKSTANGDNQSPSSTVPIARLLQDESELLADLITFLGNSHRHHSYWRQANATLRHLKKALRLVGESVDGGDGQEDTGGIPVVQDSLRRETDSNMSLEALLRRAREVTLSAATEAMLELHRKRMDSTMVCLALLAVYSRLDRLMGLVLGEKRGDDTITGKGQGEAVGTERERGAEKTEMTRDTAAAVHALTVTLHHDGGQRGKVASTPSPSANRGNNGRRKLLPPLKHIFSREALSSGTHTEQYGRLWQQWKASGTVDFTALKTAHSLGSLVAAAYSNARSD